MRKTLHTISAILITLIIFTLSPAIRKTEISSDEAILSYDFEDGDFGNWFPLGNQSKLTIDSRHSRKGKTSLYVSEREAAWSGAALNVDDLLNQGESYHFEASIHIDSDVSHKISWTLKYELNGSVEYVGIGSIDAGSVGWSEITGDALIPEGANDAIIYFEADDASVNFNIDVLNISGTEKKVTDPPKDEDAIFEYTYDFENGLDGWKSRGNPTVECSGDFSYSGSSSLHVTNRSSVWNGPTVNISSMIKAGISYQYTAYVMYNERIYEDEHVFLLELQYNYNGEEVYKTINEKLLQRGNWSKIVGEFTVPDGAKDIHLYVQTQNTEEGQVPDINDLMNFYIDDITIIDSTVMHRNEMIMNIFIAVVSVLILILCIFIALFVKRKLQETQDVLDSAAKDSMTGALNRNSYEEQINFYTQNPDKCKNIFITICDVNFLKYINDNYGHDKGDDAIRRCASVLLSTVGKKGKVYRTGGDEFVCITNNDVSEAINKALETESGNYKGYPFAAAAGTSSYDPEEDAAPDIKEIISRSDLHMYRNKQLLKEQMKKFYGIE